MRAYWDLLRAFLTGDMQSDRVVPPSGFTARLVVFSAGAMAFLAVFALALSFAADRLSDRWSAALAQTATIRISAPSDQLERQVSAAMAIVETTPGISQARRLGADETRALLSPWFGPDLPVESLPIPALIELTETGSGIDPEGLRLRLQAEAPGAVLDDHERWRRPLVAAAGRMQAVALAALLLIGGATAAMITLGAQAALAANGQVIRVLRLVGAQDGYIATAFIRRFTLRAAGGAAVGAALGMMAIALVPAEGAQDAGFLTGIGFSGAEWLWPCLLPGLAAGVSFLATRAAARRALQEIT